MRSLATAIFFLLPFFLSAQVYQKISYSVDQGLVTHLTKSVEFDSLGFLWIATDEGLVRYNGDAFKTFTEATPNRYVKQVKNINGHLLAVSDLGIVEIHQTRDTVYFEQVVLGARSETDTLLWYPKDVYEDQKGRVWVSEPRDIVRIDIAKHGIVKRYDFSEDDLSISFTNSFKFFEIDGELYTLTYTGRFHHYNPEVDEFELIKVDMANPLEEVSSVCQTEGGVFIGDDNGFYKLNTSDSIFRVTPMPQSIDRISSIIEVFGKLLVGSYNNKIDLIDIESNQIIESTTAFRMNDAVSTNGKDIWVSTDEGILMLKKNLFRQVDNSDYYIESVLPLDTVVYYCYKDEMFKLIKNGKSFRQERLLSRSDNYLLSISGRPNHIWVSNREKLHLIENNRIVRTIDLSDRGLFIFNIMLDQSNDLWLTQDNADGIARLKPNGDRLEYRQDKGIESRILIIKEDNQGNIYCGGLGKNSYLYVYDSVADRFVNKSIPVADSIAIEFEINDMVISGDSVWLASSFGIWLYANGQITPLEFDGKMQSAPVKAIDLYQNQLWFSNVYGLISYNLTTKEVRVYDEGSGLRSRSANARAMDIDKSNGTKWVGTAKGLSYSTVLSHDARITKRPIIDEILVNGKRSSLSFITHHTLPNQSFIDLKYFSLSLPGDLLEYQYMLDQGAWKSTNNSLQLAAQAAGAHVINVRAKRQGNYTWSEPLTIEYQIAPPLFLRWWFVLAVFIGLSLLVVLITKINAIRLKRLEHTLNRIVNERTDQLRQTNKELKQTNKELDMFVYSASHDLKAPLASLNGLLDLYKLEKDVKARDKLISMMSNSVNKLDTFIKEVIDYSKNARMEVVNEPVDFNTMIDEILESYRYMGNFHDIHFDIDINQDNSYYSDKNRMRIILNNLISNAIRYCDNEKTTCEIGIKIHQSETSIFIEVSDNGIGIDAEHLPKIYDMFYRAAETQTGSGLGLYIVKESVDNLNGTIEVKSKVGKGSIFTITLPKHVV